MVWLLLCAPAWAQPDLDARAAARPFAEKGYAAFEGGRYAEAIEMFGEAEEHYHAPTHVLFIARAQVALGKLAAAHASYRRVVEEALPDYAPVPFHQARDEARAELARLTPRVPSLRLSIRGVSAEQVTVSIDGGPAAALEDSYLLDPGRHRLEVAGPTGSASQQIELEQGARRELQFDLGGGQDTRATPPGDGSLTDSPLFVPAMVSLGLGVAALAAGAATGILSLERVSEIREGCAQDVCPTALQPDRDEAVVLGDVGTALLVVGGAAVATGGILLIVASSEEQTTVGIRVGPAALSLRGGF
jgi:hypothetical protein